MVIVTMMIMMVVVSMMMVLILVGYFSLSLCDINLMVVHPLYDCGYVVMVFLVFDWI